VFSPGIDGEMVTSAISAAFAIAIEQSVRVRKEQGVCTAWPDTRTRTRENSQALFSFPTVLTNLHSLWWCTSVDKVHVESEFDTAAYEVGHKLR